MRGILVVLVAGTVAIAAAPSARAHAFLDHASPAVGSSVPSAPPTVTLWFTQDLEPAFSNVTVTNEAGQRVDLGNGQIPPGSPAELQIGLKPLPPGTYLVSWHVVSVDTHPTEGTFTFEVGRGWASVRSQIVAELLIVSRLVQFAAVIVVFGCAAFRIYGLGVDSTTTSASALIIFDAWFWRVTTVGAIVALLSALSLILGVTANMAGSAAAAIGVCLAPRARWRMPAILVLSFLLLVSLGWVGHAVGGPGGHQARPPDQSDGTSARCGAVARQPGSFSRAARTGAVNIRNGLDLYRARRGAALLADGIRGSGAPSRIRRAQHAAAGREHPSTGRHTLRPTAGSEDPVVPGNGHCRAVQPFSPAAALAAGSTSLSGGGRSHSLGSL